MSTIISATLVKELRERTGAGMMECKRALEKSSGDIEKAIEELRKSGITKASKKAGRIAAEGVIVIAEEGNRALMMEINSETDFVARDSHFAAFAKTVVETALQAKEENIINISALPIKPQMETVEAARLALITKVGENVQLRRAALSKEGAALVGTYLHGNRIGVLVELDINNKDLARDIAMHIAACKPLVVSPSAISKNLLDKEKEIYFAQAATSGKPQDIIEKMVAGRIKKYLDEVSLVGQPFVKDPETTVGDLLAKHGATVLGFHRFEVGEGIEKTTEDFKEAVMSYVSGG